jgi:peptide deformylase
MSECSGPDCTHPSHEKKLSPEETAAHIKTEEAKLAEETREAIRNPIITPADQERWPLLEMESQACSIPISPEDEEAILLMDALLNTLDTEAAGLAAVQVGYPRRIFLLRNSQTIEGKAANTAYINPVILQKSKECKLDNEACLSLPHMAGRFRRPKIVTIEYMDLNGNFQQETFHGFWARAVCHEIDHLNGQLITTHVEQDLAKRPRRTKFGMKITPQRLKTIAERRSKKKRARVAQRHARAIGR